MNLAFRVDASANMGLGHLRRCLSLAQALRARGGQCRFVVRDLGLDAASEVRRAGFACLPLPAPAQSVPPADPVPHAAWAGVAWRHDAEDTLTALRGHPVDTLVIDHYAFDARWHRALRAGLGCRIAAIDDLGDRDLGAEWLIDHNHSPDHRAKYAAHIHADTLILGGPAHALLAPVYANAPRHQPQAELRSIGIFMGGADADNFSLLALAACAAAGFNGAVEIATTSANPNLAMLHLAAAARHGTRVLLDQRDLSDFFARHGLQIGAGGGATWERCCIGAPTLALIAADNQRPVLLPLADLGVLVSLDTVPPTVAATAQALRRLIDQPERRAALSIQAMRLVDGQGADRVADQLLKP